MLKGEIFLGIHAEFGITVNIQHGNIEIGNRYGPFQIPRIGEGFIGNYQLPPKLFMGRRGNLREKPPIQAFYKLKSPHNHRMGALEFDNRDGKFLERGKSNHFPVYDPVVKKGEQLIFRRRFRILR
jgi:hypothetical protein